MKSWAGVECIQVFPDGTEVPTIKCFEAVFLRILTLIVPLSTLALFIMLIIGGIRYLTSGGDPKATASAQQTMTYSILGIVLIVLAYLVFRIIEVFTGVNITKFVIPS